MTKRNRQGPYVLCISNRGFRASLMLRRVYRTLQDAAAEERGLLCVVDESGESYLYPQRLFVAVEVPRAAGRAFRTAG